MAERAAWPMAVVVVLVLVEHGGGVPQPDLVIEVTADLALDQAR